MNELKHTLFFFNISHDFLLLWGDLLLLLCCILEPTVAHQSKGLSSPGLKAHGVAAGESVRGPLRQIVSVTPGHGKKVCELGAAPRHLWASGYWKWMDGWLIGLQRALDAPYKRLNQPSHYSSNSRRWELTEEAGLAEVHVHTLQTSVAVPGRHPLTAIAGDHDVEQVTVPCDKHVHLWEKYIITASVAILHPDTIIHWNAILRAREGTTTVPS